MRSYFQERHGNRLAKGFAEACGLHFYEELPLGKRRIDLGTDDHQFGIEIKSSVADLKSGCGLNQELFEYGYVVAPMNIACQVIGHLYMCGMENTGFIGITDDDKYTLVKPAKANGDVKVIGKSEYDMIFDCLCGATDKIANLFYENNAILKRRSRHGIHGNHGKHEVHQMR